MQSDVRLSDGEAFPLPQAALAVAVIGPGRVGSAVAAALAARGHRIVAVAGRTPARESAFASRFGAERAAGPAAAAAPADLVVLAVPDDALEASIAEVAPGCGADTWVVHTCGRSGAAVLAPCGDRVAAVHPATPVADGASPLDGVAFGVTCADAAWPFAAWLVGELGGLAVRIAEEDRVLYHAALVLASNVTVGLAADAGDVASPEIVLPLLRATLDNLERLAPDDALTGPVVRGDAGTVAAHLAALRERAPHLVEVYTAASRRLAARARAAGRLPADAAARIEDALR